MWSALWADAPDGPGRSRRLAELAEGVSGADLGERALLVLRGWDLTLEGSPATGARALVEQALDNGRLPEGLGWTNTDWGFEIPSLVGLAFACTDRLDLADKLFSDAVEQFEAAGWSGAHLGFAYFLLGLVRSRSGRLSEAEDFLRESLRNAARVGRGIPLQWDAVGVLADTLLARGKTAEAIALAEEYAYRPPFPKGVLIPDAPTLYGRLLLAQGRAEDAAAELASVGARLEARGWRNTVWAPWRGLLAQAVAEEDPVRARALVDEELLLAERFGTATAVGQALRTAAAVESEPEQEVRLLARAVDRLGRSPARMSTRWRWWTTAPRCAEPGGPTKRPSNCARGSTWPTTAAPMRWPSGARPSWPPPGCGQEGCMWSAATASPGTSIARRF